MQAKLQGADAICIGFCPDIIVETEREDVTGFVPPPTTLPTPPERERAVELSGWLRGPAGGTGIPISFRIEGKLHQFDKLPFFVFGILIEAIQYGLVSIGASESDPQPVRYFEIGKDQDWRGTCRNAMIDSTGERHFAEIDLEYGRDNTIWIHLRGTREVDASVRVAQTIC